MAIGDEWTVFKYEWDMAVGLAAYLQPDPHAKRDPILTNAIAECMVLHSRILIEILLSHGSQPDDINPSKLIPGFESRHIASLETAYGENRTENSPRWQFNKLLAHATTHRGEKHDYVDAINAVWPHILKIMQDIRLPNPPIDV
jgi:hypothetical protein